MAGIDLRSPDAWQAEVDATERQAWLRVNGPGPPIPRCDECGRDAVYARGDFGRPTDTPEHFCDRHAPESLKRPGDFPSAPQL